MVGKRALYLDSVAGRGELGVPRVRFGMTKVLCRREMRVESSKEEEKGYSLWEPLRASLGMSSGP